MNDPHPWKGIRPFKRHSLVLLVAGLVYFCIGLSYMVLQPNSARAVALIVVLQLMSAKAWGAVFCVAGLLSVISSRWPPLVETWGYMVLTGLSAGWATAYLMGILFADSPVQNISSFLLWSLTAFLWWAISGLLNPDRSVVKTHGGPS